MTTLSIQTLPPDLWPPFRLETGLTDEQLTMTLVGELDLACTEQLMAPGLDDSDGIRIVTIDLGGLSFIDGAGVDALLAVREAHVSRGRSVHLVHARGLVRRVFALLAQDKVLVA